MTGLIVYESELKKIDNCTFKWNPNGFILLEYDNRGSHYRLDLELQDGSKRVYGGGDYSYSISSIHLKDQLSVSPEAGVVYWLYYYVAYQGGGVWKWSKDYVKEENERTKQFRTHKSGSEDSENGHQALSWLLGELGRVTNTTQGIGVA